MDETGKCRQEEEEDAQIDMQVMNDVQGDKSNDSAR
jgi:hypothetical protein